MLYAGCSTPIAPPAPRTAGDSLLAARTSTQRLAPEWTRRLISSIPVDPDAPITDFHAGHGIATLLVAPSRLMIVQLSESRLHPDNLMTVGGVIADAPPSYRTRADLGGVIRAIGTEDSTFVTLLERETGRLVSRDAAGNYRLHGRLAARDGVVDACPVSTESTLFTEAAHPGRVRVQGISDSTPGVPAELTVSALRPRRRQPPPRLAGSGGPYCVWYVPRQDSFFVVSTKEARGFEFVESSRAVRAGASPWTIRLNRIRELGRRPETVVDVAVNDDLLAVLFAGRSAAAYRLVDFYTFTGSHLGAVRLPARVEKIALAHERLYTLARDTTQGLVMSSFVLPAAWRGGVADVPSHLGRRPELPLSAETP